MTPTFKAWQKKFAALKDYWNNIENNFSISTKYYDPSSGLNYKFYYSYVIKVDVVKNNNQKKKLKKAIAWAKAKRTLRVNKVSKQRDGEYKCTYMKHQTIVSKCGNWAKYDNKTRCRYHKKLSYDELLVKGTHQLVNGRPRSYSSTCYIKTSTIEGAGKGVFATRHFYPKDPITGFSFTRIITAAEHKNLFGQIEYDYVLMLRANRNHCFVGLTDPVVGHGLGSFINAPPSGKEANCEFKFTSPDNLPYIVALKHIYASEELFVAYNKGQIVPR